MKKRFYIALGGCVTLLLVCLILSILYVNKEPMVMIVPENMPNGFTQLSEVPFAGSGGLQEPTVLPPSESEVPTVSPVEPPVEPPIDPPVEPPIDPPVQPPVEPVIPTDPFGLDYWLYHSEDRALTTDLLQLNAKLQSGGKVHRIETLGRQYTASEVQKMIDTYVLPSVGYDKDGNLRDNAFFENALKQRNVEGIADVSAQIALTLHKAEVRAFPVEEPCYSDNLMQDLFQEASLPVGTPILLLHTSADGKYYFVRSYFYCGWIAAEDITVTTEALFSLFAAPETFAVVTKTASVDDLVMGTILPLVSQNEHTATLLVPDREAGVKEIEVFLSDISIGYLPATTHNLLQLAFSYVGTPYSWGDKGRGVDCSGLYVAVMRCMGIFLARNTGDMRRTPAVNYIVLDGKIPHELPTGSLIFRPGHVMMYLGTVEGTHYILHAPGSGMQVRVDTLARVDNLIVAFWPAVA